MKFDEEKAIIFQGGRTQVQQIRQSLSVEVDKQTTELYLK